MKTDPRLSEFLLDPSVKKPLKVDGLTGACKKLGFSDLTKNLLLAMADNNRVSYIDAVAGSFATLMAAHRGEVVCTVTTAKPLAADMAKEVEGALNGFLKANEKALINYAVDPAIVGGMVGHRRQVLRHEHEHQAHQVQRAHQGGCLREH